MRAVSGALLFNLSATEMLAGAEPTKMPIAEGGPEVEVPAMPELAQFVLPLMQGSVHQIGDLRFQTPVADYTGTLTLIARRSAQRPGVRHWRRGAEPTVNDTHQCCKHDMTTLARRLCFARRHSFAILIFFSGSHSMQHHSRWR